MPARTDRPEVRSGEPMLRLAGVTKRFGATLANDDVTFEVRRGEIHALLGENGAGKSTLMNIVYGLHQPDAGQIEVAGRPVRITSPENALELGIGMVHQHFMLVPDMTVAENLALGPSALPGLTRLRAVGEEVERLSDRFGLRAHGGDRIDALGLGDRQRVEILRLLYRGADVLILDEPTAALTPAEWRELAAILRTLADEGAAVVLITHKLDELVGVADRCTVLRDGRVVGTVPIAETDKRELARMMVGRDVTLRVGRREVAPGRPMLEVSGLTVEQDGQTLLDDVTFSVREGEVLGVAGVSGNGQQELVQALTGLRAASGGEIRLAGAPLRGGPRAFTDQGGALIPEDRHAEGVALELSVADNLLLKDVCRGRFARRGQLDLRCARQHCERLIAEYGVKAASPDIAISRLSGGHQQKVVFARELSRDPKVLVASQPTRGLDVGAIEFVYERINERKAAGAAILLLSIELDEILSLSDRVAVMAGGRFVAVLDAADADPETIGMLMGGEPAAGGDRCKRVHA